MIISGGFAEKTLHVDLTAGTVHAAPLDADMAESFIGGLGLTMRLAADAITPGTDPLSPDNPVVIGAGALVGTDIPSSSRIYAVSRLPASGTIGWCGAGGMTFGYRLKNAGFDHIVITGACERLMYLSITDDRVELRDAAAFRGRGISETCDGLRRAAGGQGGVLAIGPAGENRVAFSMACVDGVATLGRGGLGAVLGAKNLKAIVVNGSRGVAVADRKQYAALRNTLVGNIKAYPYLKEWQQQGMMKAFPVIPLEIYEAVKQRRLACVSCPIGCKDVVQIQDGPLKGYTAASSSAVNLFTPLMYGFQDYREAVKLISRLDDLGLDMFEFFGVMRFAAALVENGILAAADDDPAIVLDSLVSLEAWADRIARRRGLGKLLADGFLKIMAVSGPAAEPLAPALVKGMHPYTGPESALPWDLFGTMELGQILDPRGPHVGSGGSPTYFARRPLDVFPRHLVRMGVREADIRRILPTGEDNGTEQLNIGMLLKYSHRWFTILGSLGICARGQINRFYDASLCAEIYQAVTGIPTDLDQLRLRADRAWTLYRMLNVREGICRESGSIPRQWFTPPGFREYLGGAPLTEDQIRRMIRDYYREQGWDEITGVPTAATLENLGLAVRVAGRQ